MGLIYTGLLVFSINLPCGYFREDQKKFSFLWFLFIHLPVPFSVLFRYIFGVHWELITFPVLIGAYFSGQLIGSRFKRHLNKRKSA